MKIMRLSPTKCWIIGLLLLAALTRLPGIHWGLPYFYHVDERGFGKFTVRYFSGDLNPHFFHVPSLYTYMVAGVWGAYYLGGKLTGRFDRPADFIDAYYRDPTVFVLLGRLFTLLLCLGTVLLVFQVGRKMFSLRAGALAGLLLILALEHVKVSRYFIPDGAMVFFLMCSFLFIWLIYTRGRTAYYVLAGLMAGFAYATKYGGHFLAIPLLLAHFFRARENKEPWLRAIFSPKLLLAGLSFIVAFLVGCPYSVLDFRKFYKDFRWQSRHLFESGHYGSSTAEPSWLFYLKYGFNDNIGLLSQFLALGGVVLAFVRRRKQDLLLLSVPIPLFIIIGTMKAYATRYLLPVAPFLILLAAMFLDEVLNALSAALEKARSWGRSKIAARLLPAAIVLVLLAPSIVRVARFEGSIILPDTRTLARDWIRTHIPKGEKIGLEMYGPPLDSAEYRLHYKHSLGTVDLDWLAVRKVRYVIISDIMYSRFADSPREFPKEAAFYRSLDEKAALVKVFQPSYNERLTDLHNPTIKIYALSPYANYDFPGHFGRYRQSVSVAAEQGGRWAVETRVSGDEPLAGRERPLRPFVSISTPDGRELLHGKAPDFRAGGRFTMPAAERPVVVSIGYEVEVDSPFVSRPLRRRVTIEDGLDPEEVRSRPWHIDYYYGRFPNARGDEYFQDVTIVRLPSQWRIRSTVFGSKVRWGRAHVLNPYLRLTDVAGREIARFRIYDGRMGGLDAERKGPVSKEWTIPPRGEELRLFAGYEYFYDENAAGKAGGPLEVELTEKPPGPRDGRLEPKT